MSLIPAVIWTIKLSYTSYKVKKAIIDRLLFIMFNFSTH